MNPTEQENIIAKIRREYTDLAGQFNEKFFDGEAFERRLTHARVHRMNMRAFLFSEVGFLEKLKDDFEEKMNEAREGVGASLDRLAERRAQKWEGYLPEKIHPLAEDEARYFYGAMREFTEVYLPVLRHLFAGTPEYLRLETPVRQVERLGLVRGRMSVAFQEYLEVLQATPGQAERIKQDILKRGAQALNSLVKPLEDMLPATPENSFWEEAYQVPGEKTWSPGGRDITRDQKYRQDFQNQTNLQVAQAAIAFALDIINNFGLRPFTGNPA